MPKYEYACRECGENLEVVQSFSDDPLTECPACGGELRKVFHSPGITFKGSGFYKTDSRDSSKKATTASESKSTSDTAKSDTKSSDTKSAETKSADKGSDTSKSSETKSAASSSDTKKSPSGAGAKSS